MITKEKAHISNGHCVYCRDSDTCGYCLGRGMEDRPFTHGYGHREDGSDHHYKHGVISATCSHCHGTKTCPDRAAIELAEKLNCYEGENFWQDVVEFEEFDRQATEAADPCGMSNVIVFPKTGGETTAVRYFEDEERWVVSYN